MAKKGGYKYMCLMRLSWKKRGAWYPLRSKAIMNYITRLIQKDRQL